MTLSKERARQRVTASTDIPRSSIFYTEDSTLLCRLLTKPKLSRRFRAVARWSLAVCSQSARIMWRSSRYVIRRIPKSRRVAITGFMALLNVLGALASPNVRHANSHRVVVQMILKYFWYPFQTGTKSKRLLGPEAMKSPWRSLNIEIPSFLKCWTSTKEFRFVRFITGP